MRCTMKEVKILQSTDINESSVHLKILIFYDVLLRFTEYSGKPEEGSERSDFVRIVLRVRHSPLLYYYVLLVKLSFQTNPKCLQQAATEF